MKKDCEYCHDENLLTFILIDLDGNEMDYFCSIECLVRHAKYSYDVRE